MTKKVLIITLYFPPHPGAGSLRLGKFARYLPSYGWEPLVLTAGRPQDNTIMNPGELSEESIFRVPLNLWNNKVAGKISINQAEEKANDSSKKYFLKGIGKTVRLFSPLYHRPEFQMLFMSYNGWEHKAFIKAMEIIQSHKPDLIFSSTSHTLAARLSRHTGIPWVAEYRDLWSLNPFTKKVFPFGWWEKRLEKNSVKYAASVIAISTSMGKELERFHNRHVDVVPNGFDEQDFAKAVAQTLKFTLTIVGGITSLSEIKEELFQALSQLRKENIVAQENFELRFLGVTRQEELKELLDKYGLSNLSVFYERVPFEESIIKQKESTALFVLQNWDDPRQKHICPGKIYEYMASGRPVLALVAEDSEVGNIIRKTGCGIIANKLPDIKSILSLWVKEFKKEGKIISHYSPRPEIVSTYEHKELMRTLAGVFEKSIKVQRPVEKLVFA